MSKWNTVRRRVSAVVLLLVGLIVIPTVPAVADGDSAEASAQAAEEDVLAQAIDWMVELLTGSSSNGSSSAESDSGAGFDPSGHRPQ